MVIQGCSRTIKSHSRHIPDDIAMFQRFNQRNFFLDVLVLSLGFLYVFDVQLDHFHGYQLSSIRQAAPDLHVTTAATQNLGQNPT